MIFRNTEYPGYPSGNNSGYYYKLDLHKYSNSRHQLYVYCYGNDGDYSSNYIYFKNNTTAAAPAPATNNSKPASSSSTATTSSSTSSTGIKITSANLVVGTDLSPCITQAINFTVGINKQFEHKSYETYKDAINCAWWAAIRYMEYHSITKFDGIYNNSGTLAAGSIVCLTNSSGGTHYAFIEGISDNTVYYSQSNVDKATDHTILSISVDNWRKKSIQYYMK